MVAEDPLNDSVQSLLCKVEIDYLTCRVPCVQSKLSENIGSGCMCGFVDYRVLSCGAFCTVGNQPMSRRKQQGGNQPMTRQKQQGSNMVDFPKALPGKSNAKRTEIFRYLFHYKILLLVFLLLEGVGVESSEFPGRECCDSVPPPPPNYHHDISTTTSTTPSPNSNLTSVATFGQGQINCIQAREQCTGEPRCREALGILKQVCGAELAACTTITPFKCRKALRTLQSFDYLSECQCNHFPIDHICYTFREKVFNHPCDIHSPEEPGYNKLVLPTCDRALRKCKGESGCTKDYLAFIENCKISPEGECEADNLEVCHSSWVKVRKSHVFGCICHPEAKMQVVGPRRFINQRNKEIDKLSVLKSLTGLENSCMKTFNETHRNRCLVPRGRSNHTQIEENQHSCFEAHRSCLRDERGCKVYLNDVMMWCEHSHCEPDRCRSALQRFYSKVGVHRRLEVAFCVCRQDDPNGECLDSMRKLHPTCAQRQTGREKRKCHEIAAHCRKNPNCRIRLEQYEKSCATDEVTQKCAGTHRACQHAVINILGTELHASCVCKGTDFLYQKDCYTWQKLLWSNACVIESHLSLQEELRRLVNLDHIFPTASDFTTTPTPPRLPSTPKKITPPIYGTLTTYFGGNRFCKPGDKLCMSRNSPRLPPRKMPGEGKGKGRVPVIPPRNQKPFIWGEPTKPRPPDHHPTRFSTSSNVGSPSGSSNPSKQVKPEISTLESTTSKSSPPRFCILKGSSEGHGVNDIRIQEGGWKRIYTKEACSSLCECRPTRPNEEMPQATCFTLVCHTLKGCNTSTAHFPHRSPYYEALRGECMCYYGNFICQRPEPNDYDKFSLGPGIYLFLGYSKHEMELLKQHTTASELEALLEIEKLLVRKYGFKCKLITKKHIGENFIIVAELRVNEDEYINPYAKQRIEKEECKQPLQELTEKINARPRHPEVSQDIYLSMFILAEVQVNTAPEAHPSTGSTGITTTPLILVLLLSIGVFLLMCEEGLPQGGLHNLDIFSRRIRSAFGMRAEPSPSRNLSPEEISRRIFYGSDKVSDFT